MAIDSTDLALVTARVGCCRLGASRLGFTPYDVKGPGSPYPCEYIWREVQPPTTQWTLLTEGVVCGKRPVADFTYSGEVVPAVSDLDVTWTVFEEEAGIPGESWNYIFTPVVTGGTAPYTYAWDFDDASPSTAEIPTHVWTQGALPNPATITVSLTVTDDLGATAMFADDVSVTFNV